MQHPARTVAVVGAIVLFAVPLAGTPPPPVPPLAAHDLVGAAPVIDGQVGAGEWGFAPQIVIDDTFPTTYVRPTYATFVNNRTSLFVLVDAPGDTTNDSPCDECFLDFAVPSGAGFSTLEAEIAIRLGQSPIVTPPGITAAVGFGPSPNSATPHRIYEFEIPLALLGAEPGEQLRFCSPPFSAKTGCPGSPVSMPYDGTTGHDNVWPAPPRIFLPTVPETWPEFGLARTLPAPALGAAGLLASMLLVALAGALLLGRRAG